MSGEHPSIEEDANAEGVWYYSRQGRRYGPATDDLLRKLIATRMLLRDSPVWRAGMPDWRPASSTEINALFSEAKPPPLTGANVDNHIVWIIAFVPILSAFIEFVLSFVSDPALSRLWWIAIPINIVLCLWDSRILKNAGHDASGMAGWAVLVPAYLFVRANRLRQNYAYAIIWLMTFGISILIAAGSPIFHSGSQAENIAAFLAGERRLSIDELKDQVVLSIQGKWYDNPATRHLRVKSLTLVHRSGNDYTGLLIADGSGSDEQYSVELTYDGKTFVWKLH